MKLIVAAALALAVALPVQAAPVLLDSFDAEVGDTSMPNYTGFGNFVVSGGTVDIIKSGAFGITCLGGSGSCVDLDGSTGHGGTLTTASTYAFAAGSRVSLLIQISGNQRGGAADEFSYGFNTSTPTLFKNVILTGSLGAMPFNVGDLGPELFLGSGRASAALGIVSSTEPFTTYGISFIAGHAGTLTAFAATASADSVGPILDDFSLSIGGAVPEPADWALMMAGFGLVGIAARLRKDIARA